VFIFTKRRVENEASVDPVELVKKALVRAVESGSDPVKEVTDKLTSAGVKVVDLRCLFGAPPRHLKSTSKADFQCLSRGVHQAFVNLEKQGFFVAENYGHCADCAARDVFKNAREQKRRKCVLYTNAETAQMVSTGICTIRYGLSYCCKTKEAQITRTRELGREVAQALTDAGLSVDWNDDPETAIKARLKEDNHA